MEKVIIKINAIIITLIISVIYSILFVVWIPFAIILDIVILIAEGITSNGYYHAYIARAYMRMSNSISTVYEKLNSKYNFDDICPK